MRLFIGGGCKMGKSSYAEERVEALSTPGNRIYLATMVPVDDEDVRRIRAHAGRREGKGYETVELARDLTAISGIIPSRRLKEQTVLVDAVTALLSNEMFVADASGQYHETEDAGEKVIRELMFLADAVKHIVFVSDTIDADGIRYDAGTERFRKALCDVNIALAAFCDEVTEVSVGQICKWKG